MFNRSLIIKASLPPECVTEEQDKREEAQTGKNSKEPEDGAPIES